ncbi:MAG TPA: hypothetical protein VF995_09160 [Actinomycetota bacterium]
MYPMLTRKLAALRIDDLQREAARQRQIRALAARREPATRPRRIPFDFDRLLSRRPRRTLEPRPDPAWPRCAPDGARPTR